MNVMKKFSVADLIIIASVAALGIAVKPIVGPISKFISTPLGIPGGSLAGGFYMMWLVLAVTIVNKRYTGTVFGVLQAVLVLLVGMAGKQGAFSLISYSLPGILADIVFYLIKHRQKLITHLSLGVVANLAGSLSTAVIFFKLPAVMVGINVAFATASGIMGGYLAYGTYKALEKARIIK
ncbi:MAG: ECF transporter S component [Candidatus Cloacimonetes bacterium]|nr:ECF transporter S component [Candidatus Cloacimonadota bacterium]